MKTEIRNSILDYIRNNRYPVSVQICKSVAEKHGLSIIDIYHEFRKMSAEGIIKQIEIHTHKFFQES